jgi:hypothetical protein
MMQAHVPLAAARDRVGALQRLAFAACFSGAHFALPGGVAAAVALLALPWIRCTECREEEFHALPAEARYSLPPYPDVQTVARAIGQDMGLAWHAYQDAWHAYQDRVTRCKRTRLQHARLGLEDSEDWNYGGRRVYASDESDEEERVVKQRVVKRAREEAWNFAYMGDSWPHTADVMAAVRAEDERAHAEILQREENERVHAEILYHEENDVMPLWWNR